MNKYDKAELIIFSFLIGFALGGVVSCYSITHYGNKPIEIIKDK